MLADRPFAPEAFTELSEVIETNSSSALIFDGHALTGKYLVSLSVEEKENMLERVFQHYRKNGFPFPKMTDESILKEFKKLCNCNQQDAFSNGEIKNSNSCGTNIIKHFCGELFYNSRGNQKSFSCIDVFNDDEKLRKVLKNRMGWSHDNDNVPYLFAMSDSMLIQGMRSSGLAYSVSQFKPVIAKYLFSRFNAKRVFDYSAGWGARCLGAMSLGIEYFAVDPLTANAVSSMQHFLGGSGAILGQCSEDAFDVPPCDFVFSSPPYFDLETYSSDSTQSIHKYEDYGTWLKNYWKPTVENCLNIMTSDGKFSFMAVDFVGKHPLANDFQFVCESQDLKLIEVIPFKTSKSHLSGKDKNGKNTKNNERVFVFERK